MHIVKVDARQGWASIDSTRIELDEAGKLVAAIATLCSRPILTSQEPTRYRIVRKVSVCGYSADAEIGTRDGRAFSLHFLFDLVYFFTLSILESKVLKACEKSWKVKFRSDSPSTAFLDSCEWGSARFRYDPKQGDLSLELIFAYSESPVDHV